MADFTVAWVSKGGSTITRPSGTFYRATAPAAGNLEAETSGTITVTPGQVDVTFTVKRSTGAARGGDLFLNVYNSSGGYLSTLYGGNLPGTSQTSTAVTKRVTIPASAARVTLAPAYYNAVTGDAIDLEPTVSVVAVGVVAPPPPAATTGTTGWCVAGDPLVPVRLTVAAAPAAAPEPTGTLVPGNFASYTVDPYSAHTSMWGEYITPQNDQLVSDSSLRVFPEFPAKTELSWNITPDPDWDNVNGYLHVDYGNYDWSPGSIVPRQVKDITALSLNVTWTMTGAAAGLLSELWLSSQSAAQGQFPKTHEIAFFPRLSSHVISYVESLSAVGSGSFTANGTTWNVVEGSSLTGEPYLIAFRPGYVDFEGALPYRDFFTFLQAAGRITGNEWVNGVAFGVEPRTGVGTLTVDTFVPTYTYGPITPDIVGPVNRLTNGSFTTEDAWTGFWYSGKSYAGGKAVFAATPAFDGIEQAGVTFVAGKYYDVTFTVTGWTAGGIQPRFLGGTERQGTERTSNGTFTERLLANTGNNGFTLIPGSEGASLTVDEVSVIGPYDSATP